MYKLDQKKKCNKHENNKNPSFSSTLLDEICRSIDDGDVTNIPKNNKSTLQKKHNINLKNKEESFVRATLMEKWMNNDKGYDHDQDVMFFSSSSLSSDSSFGGFSSSDTDSMYVSSRSKSSSCFMPYLVKPVKTKPEMSKKTERSLFDDYIDDYRGSSTDQKHVDNLVIKSKLRALKIYSKVKQPISPGGRLSTFINSLFTAGTPKKTKGIEDLVAERKMHSGQESTCSSASSFSRSCLSKNSPATREKLRNGEKRSVRFLDEDCRQILGHKSLPQEKNRKIAARKSDDEIKLRVEEMKREFLRDYRNRNQKKRELLSPKNVKLNYATNDVEDNDDASSCSSSDLFELDHLSGTSNDRYLEELPVYETTHVHTNRAIANGFLL
ncbi:hypothetical protein ACFE04_015967 [Oxalis oulophora]